MTCHLCTSDQTHLFSREKRGDLCFTILRCQTCGVIQTAESHESVSPNYVTLTEEAIDTDRIWCQSEHKQAAFRQWGTNTQKLWPHPPGRLLDVGCGTGGFLRYAAQQGWEVFGFDASQAQADHARHRGAAFAQVRCATRCSDYLAQISLPTTPFSMVTLWDVFEHIRDPKAFLEEIHALLAHEGLLFLSLPNGGALPWKRQLHRLLGRPLSLDPWEHVFYYTTEALRRFLPAWGFRVEAMGSVACYPRPWSLFEVARRGGTALLNGFPQVAPQIYCMARKVDQTGEGHEQHG